MGCDIHIYTEFKRDGAWHSADHWEKSKYGNYDRIPMRFQCYSGRCYELFSFLANVRQRTWGNECPVLDTPRGLPNDMSKRVAEEFSDACYHSASHFTLAELLAGWKKHKGAIIKYDAVTEPGAEGVQEWLVKPVETRGRPPSGYCAGSSSKTAQNVQWQETLEEIIGPMVGRITEFLTSLTYDENVKDSEVRIVFGFDS